MFWGNYVISAFDEEFFDKNVVSNRERILEVTQSVFHGVVVTASCCCKINTIYEYTAYHPVQNKNPFLDYTSLEFLIRYILAIIFSM